MWRKNVPPLIAALLCGCASAPTHYYTLRTSATNSISSPSAPVLVNVVRMPQEVDRPQMVITVTDHQVIVLEHARWASPLKTELPQVIAMALHRQIADVNFYAFRSAEPRGSLSIAIQSLEIFKTGGARVQAHWTYGKTPPAEVREGDVIGESSAPGADSRDHYAEALQTAIENLSAELGRQLAVLRLP